MSTQEAARLRAGVGKSDLTAAGVPVHDPLYAKALVLDDGRTRLAIVAMDVTAIGGIGEVQDDFLPQLRDRLERELAIPASNVLVNASHTHPAGRILCEPPEQLARAFAAVREAAAGLTPVRVGTGTGADDRWVINRTLRLRNGRHWTIRHANPCPPDEEVAGLGPIDAEIGVLRVDRLDGRPLAVVYNYACHPLQGVPGGAVTANFPGFASAVLEQALGEGALALFLQGAGGDVCELLYKDTTHPRDARPLGEMLGLRTLAAWQATEVADADLACVLETIDLPRRTDIPERVAAYEREQAELLQSLRFMSLSFRSFLPLYLRHAADADCPADYSYRYLQEAASGAADLQAMDAENRRNVERYLHNLRVMERLARLQDDIATHWRHQAINDEAGEPTVTTEVQGMRVGDFVLATSPAEVLTEVGLRVKRASPHPHTFLAAFSNGYIHYGPPADYYDKGGYEVTECFLAPEWQALYEAKAAEVLRRL